MTTDDSLVENERRQLMENRLLLYSCVTHGLRAGPVALPTDFDEDALRKGRRRLEETPTHELEQTISQLLLQARQVVILAMAEY